MANDYVNRSAIVKKNAAKAWKYGYNDYYDLIVISKTGEIGDIYEIEGIYIALPATPEQCLQRHTKASEQYWERHPLPPELSRIGNIFQWNEMPNTFKTRWVDYIEEEFERREHGVWYMNNGVKTYITGAHYMYLQWSPIDVGYPDFREANRILWIYWEACVADDRCYGIDYLKIRRSGFSYMASSDIVNVGSLIKDSRLGMLSKTGADAKSMFTEKAVPILVGYPFFFKPIQDGMDKPKTEISFRIPASKITKRSMHQAHTDEYVGLNTTIDWKNTEDNSYDSAKLKRLIHDESGKWVAPANIQNNWRVTKTCLRLGSRIVGKCMMGSSCNALAKGGENFKKIYNDSDPTKRNANGQTKSGLYKLFIPMEWNMEGFIDRYGWPVFYKPAKPVMGIDGMWITNGAIDYWEAEIEAKKKDPDELNEFYRQFPRTESHAFRDESRASLFNLTKIYQQIDYNDSMITAHNMTRGTFYWENGIPDSRVLWRPDRNGRFLVSWIPRAELQNRWQIRNGGIKYPLNEHLGAFGCDPYDISGVVGGKGSNGALHGLTKYHMEEAPVNQFFLEYIARPQTAEIFFEEVLMAIVFYGMPILAENNKPRLLYHIKNRGYRGFSMNRPDKHFNAFSKTERELGGIPNSSEDVKQSHASAIESYIEKHVGIDTEGIYRPNEEMGSMPFNKTLENWARFDISDRTKFDAAISSGLAIMANQRQLYLPIKKASQINVKFARYRNTGSLSELIQ